MTLIGPRPERPSIDKKLINLIPNYSPDILSNQIEGWAQVNYNYAANIEEVKINVAMICFI